MYCVIYISFVSILYISDINIILHNLFVYNCNFSEIQGHYKTSLSNSNELSPVPLFADIVFYPFCWFYCLLACYCSFRDDYEDRTDEYRYTENQRKPPQRRAHESDSDSLEEPRSGHKRPSRDKYYSSDEEPRFNRKQPEKVSYPEREKDRRSHHSEKSISEASSDRFSGRQHKGHQQRTSNSRHHEESTLESRSVRERQGGGSKGKGVSERKAGSSSRDHGSEADRWEMGDGSDNDYRRDRERHPHRQRRRREH